MKITREWLDEQESQLSPDAWWGLVSIGSTESECKELIRLARLGLEHETKPPMYIDPETGHIVKYEDIRLLALGRWAEDHAIPLLTLKNQGAAEFANRHTDTLAALTKDKGAG